jgi:hypothetical protein
VYPKVQNYPSTISTFLSTRYIGEAVTAVSVLQRYLKQVNLDTEEAHQRADPVDNAGL